MGGIHKAVRKGESVDVHVTDLLITGRKIRVAVMGSVNLSDEVRPFMYGVVREADGEYAELPQVRGQDGRWRILIPTSADEPRAAALAIVASLPLDFPLREEVRELIATARPRIR